MAEGSTARKLNAAARKTTPARTTRQKYNHCSNLEGLGMLVPMPNFCSRSIAFGPEMRMGAKYLAAVWQNAMMRTTTPGILIAVRGLRIANWRTVRQSLKRIQRGAM